MVAWISCIMNVSCSSSSNDDGNDPLKATSICGEWSVYMLSLSDAEYAGSRTWFDPSDFICIFHEDGRFELHSFENFAEGYWSESGNGFLTITANGNKEKYKFEIVNAEKGMATLAYEENGRTTYMHIVRSVNGLYTSYAPAKIFGQKLIWGNNVIQATDISVAEILELEGEDNPKLQTVGWQRMDLDCVWLSVTYSNANKRNIERKYILTFDTQTSGTYKGNGESGAFEISGRTTPSTDFAPESLYYDEITLGTASIKLVSVLFSSNTTVQSFSLPNYYNISNFKASYEKTSKNHATFSYSCNTSLGAKSKTVDLEFTSPTGGTYDNGKGSFTFETKEAPSNWAPYSLVGRKIKIVGKWLTCIDASRCQIEYSFGSSSVKYGTYSYTYIDESTANMKLKDENINYNLTLSFTSSSGGKYTGTTSSRFSPTTSGSFVLE